MALVTVAKARYRKALSGVSTSLLTEVLEAASDAADKFCDRVLAAADYTENLNGNGLETIWVKNFPINSITSIRVRDASGDYDTLSTDDYDTEAAIGALTFGPDNTSNYDVWPNNYRQNVEVTYNGGFADVPEAIQEAVCQIAAAMLGVTNTSANPAFKNEQIGARSYTRFDVWAAAAIPPVAAGLLAAYRNTEV